MRQYTRVPVVEISLDSYEKFSGAFNDEGEQMREMIGNEEKELYLSHLTRRQRQVAEFMFAGYTRMEIAQKLQPKVCVQAVHQIILRIRKRLKMRAEIV